MSFKYYKSWHDEAYSFTLLQAINKIHKTTKKIKDVYDKFVINNWCDELSHASTTTRRRWSKTTEVP
eukprot:4175168-Amphidinium_carterae.1